MAERTVPTAASREAIDKNVAMLTEGLSEMAGKPLPPGRPGVVFLNGFIERQRIRMREKGFGTLPDLAGSYLGEALITAAGGRWVLDPECGLGVELTATIVAFPVNKAEKHFRNGAEDSVLGFYDMSLELVEGRHDGSLVYPSDPV